MADFAPLRAGPYEQTASHDHLYAWVPYKGTVAAFNPNGFCELITANVLFVGDSLGKQQFEALQVLLGGTKVSSTTWYPAHLESSTKAISNDAVAFEACTTQRLFGYIRNDWIDPRTSYADKTLTASSHRKCNSTAVNALCLPWMHSDVLSRFGLVVMNTGAHFQADSLFSSGVAATVEALAAYPHLNVIFRTGVPGYSNCLKHANDPPFVELPLAEAFVEAHPWFESSSVQRQNKIAAELFEARGFAVLDVYPSTVLRMDGHRDNGATPECTLH